MKILLLGDNQLAITGDMFEIRRVMEQLTAGNQVDLLLRTECMTKNKCRIVPYSTNICSSK